MQRLLSRLPFVVLPAVLLGALVLGVLVWRAGDRLENFVEDHRGALVGVPFTLTDQDGHRRTSASFQGRFMLVYFGYSYCPDVCPTTLALMADAVDKLRPSEKARVVPIFITIDPERDTPKRLKEYLRSISPDLIGLTGDLPAINKAAAGYKVYFRKRPLDGGTYAMDHSNAVYLMGPDGKFVAYWDDTAIGPDKLAEEIRARL